MCIIIINAHSVLDITGLARRNVWLVEWIESSRAEGPKPPVQVAAMLSSHAGGHPP